MLSLENICWGPSPQRLLIEDISFKAEPGQITVLVGANGSGKSTLLRCIYGYNRPVSGRITLEGTDLAQLKPLERARKIAAVLQEQNPDIPLSVSQVVELGRMPHQTLTSRRDENGKNLVAHVLDAMGLQTCANRPFRNLSGGEKQRVVLARSLVQQPKVIILDEPTNHLDIRHQLELMQILRSLKLTIVMSLHDLSMAANLADQIVVLQAGHIVAHGSPQEILTSAVIKRAFQVEARGHRNLDKTTGRDNIHFTFNLSEPPERTIDND